MTNEKKQHHLPQTVLNVIDKFIVDIKDDQDFDDETINRLDELLKSERGIPKPDDIKAVLFDLPEENRS